MKKRLLVSIIGTVCAALLLFGWTALAATSSSKATSASATGTLKSLGQDGSQLTLATDSGDRVLTLAASVWVYRDEKKSQLSDLRPGDKIEAILNSKYQIAYIKAASGSAEAPEPAKPDQPAETAAPSPQPAPQSERQSASELQQTNPPAAASAPLASAAPKTDASLQSQGTYPGLDELELEADGKQFKLKVEQKKGQYELSLKTQKGGTVHLKGTEAATWIKELLASVDLKSANARRLLLLQIADHYGIDPDKVEMQLNVKWHEAQDNRSVNAKHDDGDNEDHHDDSHNNAKVKAKKAEEPEPRDKHGKAQGKEKHGDD